MEDLLDGCDGTCYVESPADTQSGRQQMGLTRLPDCQVATDHSCTVLNTVSQTRRQRWACSLRCCVMLFVSAILTFYTSEVTSYSSF